MGGRFKREGGYVYPWLIGEKVCFNFNPQKRNVIECSNYHPFISQDSEIILKIFQVRLQQCVNWELPEVHAGFRKGRGNRDQIVNIWWIIKKAREFQKKYLLLLYWPSKSLWWCESQPVENSSRHENTRSPDLPPENSVCRPRSNS